MLGFFKGIERTLRIHRFTTQSELMRARAVYLMGFAFIVTQILNMTNMSYAYGELTFGHKLSAIVCCLVTLNIITLRYSQRFQVYALIYSVLIIGGVVSSALSESYGINSSLIPFLILGVVINGFICGWRATLTFGLASLAVVWALWGVSANYDYTPIFDVASFEDRNFQRAFQASLGIVLITIVTGIFSKNMHEAFGELEAGITKAQDSDRAKTNFLATMSHELCTPMNGIIGINGILEHTDLNAEQKELTMIIRDSSRDLQTIIGNVLLFSQLDAGRVSLDDTPFDFRQAVSAAKARYTSAIGQKGLRFVMHIADTVPAEVIGDQTRTTQLIEALIDNAVKFTEAGTISLSVHGGADEQGHAALLLTVKDTGIGIAEADQERVFERFTQEDGSIKRRHGGTGLGLTVARGLAELMGGAVTVKSEPGKGSTFTVRLAYRAAAAKVQTLQAAAE